MPATMNRVEGLPMTVSSEEPSDLVEREPGKVERRQHGRLPLGLWAHCQIDGVVSQEALGDLSVGGLYLRTAAAVKEGARIRIVLGLPYIGGQRVCSLSGRVTWVDRKGDQVLGAGVSFDQETDSADAELLRGFLALWGSSSGPPSNPPPRPRDG